MHILIFLPRDKGEGFSYPFNRGGVASQRGKPPRRWKDGDP